jgi:hypothetical protein
MKRAITEILMILVILLSLSGTVSAAVSDSDNNAALLEQHYIYRRNQKIL